MIPGHRRCLGFWIGGSCDEASPEQVDGAAVKLSAKIAAIEFDGDTVRVAVVKTGGASPKVLEYHSSRATYAEPDERHEALVAAVREVLGGVRNRPAAYGLCVSSGASVARLITVPFRGGRKLRAAVPFELEPHLAFPIEQLAVDYLLVREGPGQTEVLAMGVQRASIDESLSILEEAGIRVQGVGLDALGLTALWDAEYGAGAGVHALVHVGESGSVLVGLRDRKLAYLRHVELTPALLVDDPEATGRVLKNALKGFQSDGDEAPVIGLRLTGVSLEEEAIARLTDACGLPVRCDELAAVLKGANTSSERMEDWAACIGTAFASAGGAFAANFLGTDRASAAGRAGLLRPAVTAALLAVLALGAYGAGLLVERRQNDAQIERIGARIWSAFAAAFPGSDRARARPLGDIGGFKSYDLMRDAVEAESLATESVSVELFARPTLLAILQELTRTMPKESVTVTNLSIRTGKKLTLKVTGTVKDTAAFDGVLGNLERSTLFTVDPDGLKRSSSGGIETFTIMATH